MLDVANAATKSASKLACPLTVSTTVANFSYVINSVSLHLQEKYQMMRWTGPQIFAWEDDGTETRCISLQSRMPSVDWSTLTLYQTYPSIFHPKTFKGFRVVEVLKNREPPEKVLLVQGLQPQLPEDTIDVRAIENP